MTMAAATNTSLEKKNLRCFKLYRAYSTELVQFVKCWQILPELNSKRLYQSSGKEKDSCCLVFLSSTKREIRHFHVVVAQKRQRNLQKSVMTFSLPSPSSLYGQCT